MLCRPRPVPRRDPAAQGLVASLARPGGNITGFSGNTGPDFEGKRLQLLTEVAPNLTRAAYLGLKLETVSRLFSRFHQEGLIQVQGRSIKLLDIAALKELLGQRC